MNSFLSITKTSDGRQLFCFLCGPYPFDTTEYIGASLQKELNELRSGAYQVEILQAMPLHEAMSCIREHEAYQ